jgi:hypothetical protein
MWIYTQSGFFSIVKDRLDPDVLVVRSRIEGDLERLWPDVEVINTLSADYTYRARLRRREVAAVIAKEVLEISYSNFKDSIMD